MGKDRKITWSEIAKHKEGEDLWVVIEGKVYAPGSYLNDHPGGPLIIQN